MAIRYAVDLTDTERGVVREILSKNRAKRSTIINAYILLKADRTCGWTNADIALAYEVSTKKVEQLKKRFVEEGFEAALYRKPVTNVHRRKITAQGERLKLAPCGRTFLIHHMPGAPPTLPSTQSCQRELSHGLFPIPVRSSVWWDTATGTITPSLDLAQFVIDHAVTRVPHLPQDHLPATPSTPQRITPRTGEHTLAVGPRRDAIRPPDQPTQCHHQRGEHPLHLLGLTRGMETIIANAVKSFRQNMLHHPTNEGQCRDLLLLPLLGLVIVLPIPHPLAIVTQDASQGDWGTDNVFRQVVRQPLAARRDLPLFQVGHETAGILVP